MLDPMSPQLFEQAEIEVATDPANQSPSQQSDTEGLFRTASAPPRSVANTDLPLSFLVDLTAKFLQSGGTMTPSGISAEIKLPRMVFRQIFEEMNRLMLVEAQGLEADTIRSEIRYRLTDLCAKRALGALMVS